MPVAGTAGLPFDKDVASSFLRENPLLVAGILIGTLIALGVAWLVLRRLRRTKGEKLARLLSGYDSVSVLMHPNPDPDAMSVALGAKALAESVDTDGSLYYPGQIRHQENRAFETVLDLDFEQIEAAEDLSGDAVVLVDHNEPRGFTGSERVDPAAIVDHHPGGGKGLEFTDVRTEVGACASIFAEYFRDMGWEPVTPDDAETLQTEVGVLEPHVSTGLVYGILSDTTNLTKGCSAADFAAVSYLYPGVDEDCLDRIANPEVDAEVLDVKASAITNREVQNPFAVTDVGTVSNADTIPQAADELLRLEGVTAVVVMGDRDGQLHLSGRSRDDRVHMGKTLETVVEEVPMANAGGHARMGGGQLSLEHMEGLGPGDGMTREEFADRLFEAMTGDF